MLVTLDGSEQRVSDVGNFSATRKELEAYFEIGMTGNEVVRLLWKDTTVLPEQKRGLATIVDKMSLDYHAKPLGNSGVVDKYSKAIRQIVMLSNGAFLAQFDEAEAPTSNPIADRLDAAEALAERHSDAIDGLLARMDRKDTARDRVHTNTNGSRGTKVSTYDLARTLHARIKDLREDPETHKVVERILKGIN